MYPTLFELGPVTIYSYGFFLATAYLAGTFFFWREGKKRGYKEEKLIDLSVIALIAAIVGGRLFYILINQQIFSGDLWRTLAFWDGGFAYYGSLIFVLITCTYFIRKWKWDFFQIADIAALSVLLATIFAKIGSFLAGNDYGSITKLAVSVSFPLLEGNRHPVQIYDALIALILFIILYRVYQRRLNRISDLGSGAVFFYYLVVSSLVRFFMEQFRGDSTFIGPVKLASLLSLTVAIISAIGLYYYQFRNFSRDTQSISKYFFGINLKIKNRFKR